MEVIRKLLWSWYWIFEFHNPYSSARYINYSNLRLQSYYRQCMPSLFVVCVIPTPPKMLWDSGHETQVRSVTRWTGQSTCDDLELRADTFISLFANLVNNKSAWHRAFWWGQCCLRYSYVPCPNLWSLFFQTYCYCVTLLFTCPKMFHWDYVWMEKAK